MYSVLVTGVGGPAGMAAIQSLRVAPEPIRICGVDMDPMAPGLLLSDEKSVVPSSGSPGYTDSLLRLCSKWKIDTILPTVDEEVAVLAGHAQRFTRAWIALPLPEKRMVDLARDKLLMVSLGKSGLDVPKTFSFESTSSLRRTIAKLGLPCVLKQRIGRGGRGFAIIETLDDARYWRKKREKEALILQEKVEGDVLLVQGIALKGKLLVSIVHKRLAAKSPGSGTAIAAVTMKDSKAVEQLRRVVEALSWTGALGVEFIHDPISRRYGMIDINPRICGQSHLSTMAGLNLAYGLVQLARGERLTVGPSYRSGLAFVRTWKDEMVRLSTLASDDKTTH